MWNKPFLFESVFQHFYPADQIVLQIFLSFSLPLQKRYAGLIKRINQHQFRSLTCTNTLIFKNEMD